MLLKIIARIRTDFPDKFGIPRQSGLIDELIGRIEFEPEYRSVDSVRDLGLYTHIWLLWGFSLNDDNNKSWNATVRPPRLGGNRRVGVFASRSPFRPNPIGLSSVKLERIDAACRNAPVIYVSGIDMADNTPIYDIKPYIPYCDSHPEASDGFALNKREGSLEVAFEDGLIGEIPENKRAALIKILSQDPRPQYHNYPDRMYYILFGGFEVGFYVKNNTAFVCRVNKKE